MACSAWASGWLGAVSEIRLYWEPANHSSSELNGYGFLGHSWALRAVRSCDIVPALCLATTARWWMASTGKRKDRMTTTRDDYGGRGTQGTSHVLLFRRAWTGSTATDGFANNGVDIGAGAPNPHARHWEHEEITEPWRTHGNFRNTFIVLDDGWTNTPAISNAVAPVLW